MVVVGGLGTVHGAVYGAILIGFLEASISILKDVLPPAIGNQPGLEPGLFGLILVLFIIFEPEGVYRWLKFRTFRRIFRFTAAIRLPSAQLSEDGAHAMSFFEIENLSLSFGGVKVVDDVSFAMNEGEVFNIVGPNGRQIYGV